MKKAGAMLKLFVKVFGGRPHYPSAFILLLAFVPAIQLTTGILQIMMFVCLCLTFLWIVVRIVYISLFSKEKRAEIESKYQS